jgi:type I restriction enzyme S subunit
VTSDAWRELPLKRIASLESGDAITSEEIVESGDFPVYGGNGVRGFAGKYNRQGDHVLVGRQGALCGNVILVSGRFWASEHAVVVTPRPGTHVGWLAAVLESMNLGQYSQSAAQPGLAVEAIANLRLPVPPSDEQARISDHLDVETARLHGLMTAEQRRSELAVARVVTLTLVLGRQDNRAEVRNDPRGPLEPVPSFWTLRRNKSFMREVVELSESGTEELLTVSHITGVTPRAEKDVTMFLATTNEGYKVVGPGDLVVNTMWAWMGALAVSQAAGIVSPAYGVYRFVDPDVDHRYFDALFRSPAYVAEMTRYSKGVWTSRLRLYPEAFLAIRTPFPPPREQTRIADAVDELLLERRRQVSLFEKSIALLQERRQALITTAVTGEIEIPGVAA